MALDDILPNGLTKSETAFEYLRQIKMRRCASTKKKVGTKKKKKKNTRKKDNANRKQHHMKTRSSLDK